MSDRDTRELHLLARAMLLGIGPVETARALRDEFGWDAAVLALAQLPEPQAAAGLWAAVAGCDDRCGDPPSS